MQHEVFANNNSRSRVSQPFLTVLQSDFAAGPVKLVCPLFRTAFVKPSRSAPAVEIQGETLVIGIQAMFALNIALLRRPIGSIAAYRDDIVRALDWLFTGI